MVAATRAHSRREMEEADGQMKANWGRRGVCASNEHSQKQERYRNRKEKRDGVKRSSGANPRRGDADGESERETLRVARAAKKAARGERSVAPSVGETCKERDRERG